MCKTRIPIAVIADIVLQRIGNLVSSNFANGITVVINEGRTQFRGTKSQCAGSMIERTVKKTAA